jgi:CubicO group peptidase (beta-lactamase class C family)
MRALVLDPLGMRDSGYGPELPAGQVALGHLADGSPYSDGWRVFPELAASGLWCTPADLAKVSVEIARAAGGDRPVFLDRELARAMITPTSEEYGLGATVAREADAYWFGHPGDALPHQCFTATDLHSGTGLVVMANIGGDAPLLADLLNELGVHIRYLID